MLGMAFVLLERAVSTALGEDAWDEVLDRAGSDGLHTLTAHHPDEELLALATAAAEVRVARAGTPGEQGVDLGEVGAWLADALPAGLPRGIGRSGGTTVAIAAAVARFSREELRFRPGTEPRRVEVLHEPGQSRVVGLSFEAPSGTCRLVEGLLVRLAEREGESLTVLQPKCVDRGAASCLVVCRTEEAA